MQDVVTSAPPTVLLPCPRPHVCLYSNGSEHCVYIISVCLSAKSQEGRDYMTCGELIEAINGAERHFRPYTSWFDGIDMHHRFLESFRFDDSKNFVTINWGS